MSTSALASFNAKGKPTTDPMVCLWSTRSPSALFLVADPTALSASDNNGGGPQFREYLAYTGSSCNAHELAALHAVVEAHEAYYDASSTTSGVTNNPGDTTPMKMFSRKCRGAIQQCLLSWGDDIRGRDNSMSDDAGGDDTKNNNTEDDDEDERISFELLQEFGNYVHLSEVMVPILATPALFDQPGTITASLVRYLRYRVLVDDDGLSDYHGDKSAVARMLESTQPEAFGGGELFWKYATQLVARGRLEDAWNVLRTHSVYIQSLDPPPHLARDPYWEPTLANVRECLSIVRELFRRAPLPGGRSHHRDAELMMTGDDAETEAWGGWEDSGASLTGGHLLEGLVVSPTDYKYWEQPEHIRLAMDKFHQWQTYARQCRETLRGRLAKLIPQIDGILAIMCGDESYEPSSTSMDPWAERLCAELLYWRPDWRPRDLAPRTLHILNENPSGHAGHFVSMMEGNIGRAVELMYAAGGSSGAALPATMLAVLFNIYHNSGILPEHTDYRKVEFLCESASAIVGSLTAGACQFDDVATRLALRLLVPVAAKEGSSELVDAISSLLEHTSPSSDAEVREIIAICKPMVELKSLAVLDSCSVLIHARSEQCKAENRHRDAMTWLTAGVELEEMLLTIPTQGLCYRAILRTCYQMVESILNLLNCNSELSDEELTSLIVSAREMSNYFSSDALDPELVPECKLLVLVVGLYHSLEIDEVDYDRAADAITQCFEETRNEDGSFLTLLPQSLHWSMIRCAHKCILERRPSFHPPSFTRAGITSLMQSMNMVVGLKAEEAAAARLALSRELSKCLVAENARLQDRESPSKHDTAFKNNTVLSLKSPNLSSSSIGVRVQVIQQMLESSNMYV